MTRFKLAVPLVCALVVAAPRASSQSPDASAQRVERLLRQMTLEEKVGQMTQLGLQVILSRPAGPGVPAVIDSAKLHDVVVKRGVGALLNAAYVAMSPEEWRAANDMIARFAARSRLKVPVVYGIDAVHGQHYQTTSTIFPHNIAMAATFNPGLVRRSNEITAYETRAPAASPGTSPPCSTSAATRRGRATTRRSARIRTSPP